MTLYPYQERVRAIIRQGKSVILQAPTGAGKTRAALSPFIEAFFEAQGGNFPRKCVYSVPMRVLANQFQIEYTDLASRHQRRFRPENAMDVRIQTGEHAEDPEFTGDLIFATIDQSLSSALAVPYSVSPRRGNINAGAIFSSYLIFDEFHLFPVDESEGAAGALVTTLQLLTKLKDIIPFVLMTATFSSTMLAELAEILNAEVVTVPKAEYLRIASGTGKSPRRRFYHVKDAPLNAERVLEAHSEEGVTRSIVVCNQVKRAQDLFLALCDKLKGTKTEVRLLHSRFTQEDRQAKEAEIQREFGKDKDMRQIDSFILVATQVVEVGLDITCDRFHTEIAPANAVFQRAGRCARYPGEEGHVHIYPVPERELKDGGTKPDYLPYPASLCASALDSFTRRDGAEIDFEGEQEIIDEVHTESDRMLLDAMKAQRGMIWEDIFKTMQENERSYRQSLIRRIDSVTVLAADDPADLGNPFACQGFSLFRGSVHGIWRDLQAYAEEYQAAEFEDAPWTMKYPLALSDASEDSTVEERFRWQPVIDADMINTSAMVAINSAFCSYDDKLGFRIEPAHKANHWQSTQRLKRRGQFRGPFKYALESYEEHIQRMIAVYEQHFRGDYDYVQRRLASMGQIPADGLDRAIRLAIACHDLGKLDKRWQHWVRLYQQGIGQLIVDTDYMAVHTNFDPDDEVHIAARNNATRKGERPKHAGESTVAAARFIARQPLGNT
ncbi:MAG: CRISPR-associated helicase Cas3' [Caldilineaceae bacterium]